MFAESWQGFQDPTQCGGGEPNKSAGVINVSSLLKTIDELSQYPKMTTNWQQQHGEQYLAEWESNIRQKEKVAFSIPNLGTLPVCLLLIRISEKSLPAALKAVRGLLKNQEVLNQLSTDEHGTIPIIVWQGVTSFVVSVRSQFFPY